MNMQHIDAYGYVGRGLRLLVAETGENDRREPKDMIWHMLRQAAAVSRSFPPPPRTDHPSKSAMPDAPDDVTYWQRQVEAFAQKTTMQALYGTRPRIQYSATQVSDAELTLRLFHRYALHGRGKRRELMRAVYAYAAGMRAAAVRQNFGLSRYSLMRRVDQACEDMLDGLRRENPYG